MRNRLLFVVVLLFLTNVSFAQIVGPNTFLQGHWLEIGICPIGALGSTVAPPGTYHPHPAGTNLAEVYDYGHDGWTVGAPPYMGDYTYPGSPFEGWEIQANGTRVQAYYNNWPYGTTWTYSGGGSMGAGLTAAYSNSGGVIKSNMTGTYTFGGSSLLIKQETRVDTQASWVVITTKLYNTGGTNIPGVYYWRSCDPDNDETWPGGGFPTDNYIDFQNDVIHRVQVRGVGQSTTRPPLGLCTKDCRAVATIYTFWGLTVTADLASVWGMSTTVGGTSYYGPIGTDHPGDIGIGLVFNVGTINAGDSNVVSCAYTFNGINGIDSAFREPGISINGGHIAFPPAPYPSVAVDTYNACLYPGVTLVPIDLLFAEQGSWTWSKWKWSPSTGLSATTGAHVIVNTVALPPTITYTVTGTDSLTCQYRTMLITFTTCNNVRSNTPCVGDTLFLRRVGDSTGCTYFWYGPGGYTSTQQDPFIYPATMVDSGKFYVVRTLAGVSDTDSINVTVHYTPVITASNNSPLCLGIVDTLLLTAGPGMTGMSWAWTGPSGFNSTLENPSIPGFNATNVGAYTVVATTIYGCKGTATTYGDTVTRPLPPIITGPDYCENQPFVPWSISGLQPGGVVLWYSAAVGGTSTTTSPVVPTTTAGTYKYYFSQKTGSCESVIDSITITVFPGIVPWFDYSIHYGCVSDTVYFYSTSTNSTTFLWTFGDPSPNAYTDTTFHIYNQHNLDTVQLDVSNVHGCTGRTRRAVDLRHGIHAIFTPSPDTLCVNNPVTFADPSYANDSSFASLSPTTYLWDYQDGGTDNAAATPHTFTTPGHYYVKLKVTDAMGCPDSVTHDVTVVQIQVSALSDTTLCLSMPLALVPSVNATPAFDWTYSYSWSESPSTNLDDPNIKIPHLSGFGTFTDVLTVTIPGVVPDGCPASATLVIHSVMGATIGGLSVSETVDYGSSIQLNATGEVIYHWAPDDGSLDNNNINNPIATPEHTTTYTVWGYDVNGCIDSAQITIFVDTGIHDGIPCAFTPNNDGKNDIFMPVGSKFQRLVEFRVYNRWGQELFYSNNKDHGWDGKYHGVPQDMGTYHFQIIVANPGGANKVYKGNFELIR